MKSNLTVGNTDKHYLSHVIKFSINSDKACRSYILLIGWDKNDTLPLWSSSLKICNLSLMMRRTVNMLGANEKIKSLNTEIENLSKHSSVEFKSRKERTDEKIRSLENMTVEIA